MLTQDEELWQKELSKQVEDLLTRDPLAERNISTRNHNIRLNLNNIHQQPQHNQVQNQVHMHVINQN